MNKKLLLDYRLRKIGWSIFIVECSDKTLYVGITRDMKKELAIMNSPNNIKNHWYFKVYPYKLPVKLVYEEKNVPFREAFAKISYLKGSNSTTRRNLIRTRKWCGSWRLYYYGYRMKEEKSPIMQKLLDFNS